MHKHGANNIIYHIMNNNSWNNNSWNNYPWNNNSLDRLLNL